MEKLRVLKNYCNLLSEKITNERLIKNGLDKKLVGQELSFIDNLVKEGKVGNFSNIDKHLVWDEFRKGANKWVFNWGDYSKLDNLLNRTKELKGKNGLLEPKQILCSKCKKNEVVVKFVIAQQNWSKKNNWGFWTENEKYKDQEWCGQCLRQTFYDKETYWQAVQSSKRRSLFRVYLARGEI